MMNTVHVNTTLTRSEYDVILGSLASVIGECELKGLMCNQRDPVRAKELFDHAEKVRQASQKLVTPQDSNATD